MLESIRYVMAVFECGSFSKAAEKLYITQPALSIAVRKAEKELGTTLFDRSSKPIRLTETGELYIKAAKQILSVEAELKDEIGVIEQGISGNLVIGAASISMTYLVPEILKRFKGRYPNVAVDVREESFYVLKDMLRSEDIDLAVETDWFEEDLTSERLFQNYVLLAVPKILIEKSGHAGELFEKGMSAEEIGADRFLEVDAPRISMQEVKDLPFLLLQPRNELSLRAEYIFQYYGEYPAKSTSFNQQNTAYRFAGLGFGAAMVSDTLVKYSPCAELLYYQFDCPMTERWVAVGYKKKRYMTRAMKAFIEVAKEVWEQHRNP